MNAGKDGDGNGGGGGLMVMDRMAQVILSSSASWAVLQDPLTRTFDVLRTEDVTDAVVSRCLARGIKFFGVVGVVDGVPEIYIEAPAPLNAEEIQTAAQVAVRHIAAEVSARLSVKPALAERAESEAFGVFMRQLLALEDPR